MDISPLTDCNAFVEEVSHLPGGERLRQCIQCGTCTASCPNAWLMDHPPRQLFAMARAGMRREVLSSNSMWVCLSCYLCSVRCPRDIRPTELMYTFASLAVNNGKSLPRTATPALYRCFNDFIYGLGRVPDAGFMIWFGLRGRPLSLLYSLPLAFHLLRRRRLPWRAGRIKPEAESQLRAILDKARELEGPR